MIDPKLLDIRRQIHQQFIQIARQENAQTETFDLEKLFDEDDKGKRILFCIERSLGDCFICTALFKSIKDLYPQYNLYVATQPQNFEIFDGNPYIYKTIQYLPVMENEMLMTGSGEHKGYVNTVYYPAIGTQKILNYLSIDKIALN